MTRDQRCDWLGLRAGYKLDRHARRGAKYRLDRIVNSYARLEHPLMLIDNYCRCASESARTTEPFDASFDAKTTIIPHHFKIRVIFLDTRLWDTFSALVSLIHVCPSCLRIVLKILDRLALAWSRSFFPGFRRCPETAVEHLDGKRCAMSRGLCISSAFQKSETLQILNPSIVEYPNIRNSLCAAELRPHDT
jgi:hypothetical protein